MAIRDTWHRSLVYFGLAEDYEAVDAEEEYYEPATGAEDVFDAPPAEAPPSRRSRSRGSSREERRSRDIEPAPAAGRDEIDDIFGDDTPAPARRNRSRVLESVDIDTGSDSQVHMVTPDNFNDAQQIADQFKRTKPVIINLQGADTELSKRLIDFASGLTYALGGGMQRIADKVFLLSPRNVEVSADERERILERGFFNQS